MPTFNQAKFCFRALISLLNQSMPATDYELIVVNDGSTDDTDGIVSELLAQSVNMRYYGQDNFGTAEAFNTGLELAEGEYETFVSSDNVYDHKFLEVLAGELDRNERVGLVYSDFQFMDVAENMLAKVCRPEYVEGQLIRGHVIGLCFMWRASLRKKIGGFNPKYRHAHDYDFFLRMEEITMFKHVAQVLGYCRIHSSSASATNHRRGVQEVLEILAETKMRRERR
jgi:glycosyltransferase involved in cell wall biosynthesis